MVMRQDLLLAVAALLFTCFCGVNCHGDLPHPLSAIKFDNVRLDYAQKVTLSADTYSVYKSGDHVKVTWSGIENPGAGDWVAVYAPASVDITKRSPVKFFNLSQAKGYATGGASFDLRLLNLRTDYSLVLMRNGTDFPVAVARSDPISFINVNEPTAPRLSITTRSDELRLMWTSAVVGKPVVHWGRTQGDYSSGIAKATSVTYTEQDMCGAPANAEGWLAPGALHTAFLTGLEPGASYFYRFGNAERSSDSLEWSEEMVLTVPPLGGAPAPAAAAAAAAGTDETVEIAVFGDMGAGQADGSMDWGDSILWSNMWPALRTLERLQERSRSTDLVLHIGDIAYAEGYSAQWDEFHALVAPLASRVPWLACPGNHERDYSTTSKAQPTRNLYSENDSGGECGVPFEVRYPIPSYRPSADAAAATAAAGDDPNAIPPIPVMADTPWYNFTVGPVAVVVMSTEHDYRQGTAQHTFLQQAFSAADRDATPWLVLAGHRPMYINSDWGLVDPNPTSNSDNAVSRLLRMHVEPLLQMYQVDMAFWGHHHSYQRTCAVFNGKCGDRHGKEWPGTVHMGVGMAGAYFSKNLLDQRPEWSEYVNVAQYGHSRLAANSTHLRLEFLLNVDGSVADSETLLK